MTTVSTTTQAVKLPHSHLVPRKKRNKARNDISITAAIDCAAFAMAIAGISSAALSAAPGVCKSSCSCHLGTDTINVIATFDNGEGSKIIKDMPCDQAEFILGTRISNMLAKKLPYSMIAKNKKVDAWTIYQARESKVDKRSWAPFEFQYDDDVSKFALWVSFSGTSIVINAEHARTNISWITTFQRKYKNLSDITPNEVSYICNMVMHL